ncbi:receptor-interacting serine/threonine-protein kinase 3-like isoform X2 [Rana temporaria]|uniref:receptor-interacting serine/threonine-protein kinase 3-like isoform X2 n=1 Tax=Rana temporaria TaxID=8407 RepID=UPI001AADB595|nr:receptor-interacting serine/threonine-protein kinase 3-like isoform X2 [Rana temporaria]
MQRLPPGDLESLKLVGRGGFGEVYRGWSQNLQMEVALKVVQGASSSNLKRLMKDLMKERDVMQKASNPHVLRLLGVYEKAEGSLVEYGLVMEYMSYGSLRTLFDDIPDVPWALRFQILHQVVLGMNYLHSLDPPIIHRDLKPCNVLLNKHLDVQITDFGLSKIIGATSSAVPSFAGTLPYMPPEALNNINYEVSKSHDVYSFGILVWTVFSGEEPYPDCSECTSGMYKAYQTEAIGAVRSVEDHLINLGSSDQEAGSSSDYASGGTDEFLKALENGGMSQDSQQSEPKAAGEDPKHPTALETVGETNKNEEDTSNKGDPMDTLLEGLKNTGDYKKIMGKLNNEGVLSEEDQEKLNSSQNLKDFGNAAKVFRKKLKEEPAQILPMFKSLLNL